MPTFVAVYYPARGPPRSVLSARYTLSPNELDAIRLQMRGVAVTYNHVGVAGALWRAMLNQESVKPSTIRAQFDNSTRPEESVLGQVEEAWEGPDGAQWCSFSLFAGESSAVAQMIISGLLRGVSLTHYRQKPIAPLELSLCKTPARPQCSVRHIARSPLNFQRYKGLTLRGLIPSTMASTTPVPSAEKALSVINSLPEQDQQLLLAAFNGLNEQLNDAVAASKQKDEEAKKQNEAAAAKLAEVETNLKKQIAQAGVDSTILASELRGFQETLGAVLEGRPELAKIVSCKELADKCLTGMSHQQMNGMNALVTCASKAVMMLQDQIAANGPTTVAGRKRVRIDEASAEAPSAPIIEPTAPAARLSLRDALARTFENI